MKFVTSFPHHVREIENEWIPLADGCRLAARLWLPEGVGETPVPAVVEYLPYRKRDGTRERDEPMHRYFAGHGYAAVRIDLRGSGDSDGILGDEYSEEELRDGVEALAWVAAQPWCSGSVGMIGKSWGGFNALQVAALQPPALKAIITVCSTDDRYADDAHFMGGCLLTENLVWGSMLFTMNARAPDPLVVGDRWRQMWRERLESNPLFLERWLAHQTRDAYWKHGSVCEDFSRIRCAVYAVGGWADAYSNAVPRLLAGLGCPRKGLVGPWAHVYPHDGVPGPAIGFLQEAVRWWDQWLKGHDTGIMEEPVYRVWMQQSAPPMSFYDERPGRWVAEKTWPSPRIVTRRFCLHVGRLDPTPYDKETTLQTRSPLSTGLASGSWCAFGLDGELPRDQREDDGRSLVFDSDPLPERLEILGAPVVRLHLASDRPVAMVAIRLNDVSPDGSSTRVTYGLLNLTHRDGHEVPAPLRLGELETVEVRLGDIAHSFPAGHRLRLAISTSYWPVAWPAPEAVTLSVRPRRSVLDLPTRVPHSDDGALRPFPEPESGPATESTDLDEGGSVRTIRRDPVADEVVVTIRTDVGEDGAPVLTRLGDIDLEVGHAIVERFRIRENDPLSAQVEISHRTIAQREGWKTEVQTRTRFSATRSNFHIQADLDAYEGQACVFSRSWDRTIPRKLV